MGGIQGGPHPGVIAEVRRRRETGARLFCWSAAGAEAARDVAEGLGIADLFEAFLPKPTVMIDDRAPAEWRDLVVVHPSACEP